MPRTLLALVLLLASLPLLGCRICPSPFDYCGPVLDSSCGDSCCPNAPRAGSILSGLSGPAMAEEGMIAEGESLPDGEMIADGGIAIDGEAVPEGYPAHDGMMVDEAPIVGEGEIVEEGPTLFGGQVAEDGQIIDSRIMSVEDGAVTESAPQPLSPTQTPTLAPAPATKTPDSQPADATATPLRAAQKGAVTSGQWKAK